MADLAIITWLWGPKYASIYVERLQRAVSRHLKRPFRFLMMTERERKISAVNGIERHAIKDPHFTKIDGCFARLRMFDPGWQKMRGLEGYTIVNLDLDVVITGSLDELFARTEPLVVLKGANSVNPCPFNNSVFLFQAGAHPELWSEFSLARVAKIQHYKFPDDQGWFWDRVPNAATWQVGSPSGIYAFRKPGWPLGDNLPANAKIVAFPGHRDPGGFTRLDWVKRNWEA